MPRKKKTVILRDELRQLVDQLPDRDLYAAKRFLAYLRNTKDPMMQKLVEAPYDDEPLTEKDKAALAEGWEALARGDVYSDEEVRHQLGL
jgi:putative heme degradation protein